MSLLSGINRASRATRGRPPCATTCFFLPTCLMAHTARSHGMNSEFMGTAVRSSSALARLPVRDSRESTLYRNGDPSERNYGEDCISVPYSNRTVYVEVNCRWEEGITISDLLFKFTTRANLSTQIRRASRSIRRFRPFVESLEQEKKIWSKYTRIKIL